MKEQELINISIESELKIVAEKIFEEFGMTKSEAIELFYRQVALTKDIPFAHKNLNEKTIKAIEELNSKENLSSYENFAQLRHDLGV